MKFKKLIALTTALSISIGFIPVKIANADNNPLDSIKGYWSFENIYGDTVSDDSGNNNNATIIGNGTITEEGINGKGLRLTGDKGSFLSIPSIINTATEDISISLWVNMSSEQTDRSQSTIFVQQEGSGRSLLYCSHAGAGDKLGSYVGAKNTYSSNSLSRGKWYNVAINTSYEDKIVELYINGELEKRESITNFANSNDPLRIGDHKNNDGFALKGIVDEIMIFNRNLSQDEMKDLYYRSAPIDELKKALISEIGKAKEVYELGKTILGEGAVSNFLVKIEESELLIEENNEDKNAYIEKINTLPELTAEVESLINAELGNKVFINANVNNVFREITDSLYGANHRYHKSGYSSYDSENLEMKEEFDRLYEEASFGSVRYPGGKVANLFEWKRSIGDVEDRKHTIHGDPNQIPEFPYFGLDEAAGYAEEKGSEFVYVYNLGNGSKEDAADLIEYLNCEVGENPNGGVDWAQVRADNGHSEPYGVTHFELGNEFQLGEQGYWVNNASDRLGAYINGGDITFNNQYIVEDEDWRVSAGRSDGQPNQEKLVRYFPVKEETLVLTVGGTTWTKVDSLNNSGEENVYEYDNETGIVKFGDGVNGNIPAQNTDIKVSYVAHRDGFNDYYEAMKAVDPDIKLYSSYESKDFITRMGTENPYDGIVVHPYSGTIDSDDVKYYEKILYRSEEKVDLVQSYENKLIEVLGEETADERSVIVSEYGIFNDTSRFVKSQVSALYTAKSIIGFADIESIPFATRHCLVDFPQGDLLGPGVQAIIQSIVDPVTGEVDFVATPSAKMFELFNKLTGTNVLIESIINNKKLDVDGNRSLDAVDVMITTDDEGSLYLMLVNTAKENTDVRVSIEGFDFTGKTGQVMLVDGPSYDAENTVANKDNVVVEETTVPDIETNYLDYTLTPHSVTAIKFEGGEVNPPIADKSELEAVINRVSELNEADYTGESWSALQEALNNANTVFNNTEATQEDIDLAKSELQRAIDELVIEDKDELFTKHLEIAVELADAITKEELKDVVPVVKKEFADALAEAKAILALIVAEETVTQEKVNNSFDRLSKVMQLLEHKGNKTELLTLVTMITELKEDKFTTESWNKLQEVLNSDLVQEAINNENALQSDIEKAYNALKEAFDVLELRPEKPQVDKSKLEALVNKVGGLDETKYIDSTWSKFSEELQLANSILANGDVTQEEVDSAYDNLIKAYLELRLKPNKDLLEDLINKAEALNKNDYTKESWKAVDKALKTARSVMKNDNATDEEVKNAEKSLEVALENLQEKNQNNNGNGNNNGNVDNNNSNSGKLPQTGGTNTTPIVVVCLILIGAGSILVFKKKRK